MKLNILSDLHMGVGGLEHPRNDAEWLIGSDRAQLWIHGHTHDSFDYPVNGTRVLCNPRGYAKDGVSENPFFDPDLVVEVR
mgnify:CR=1 FL=1